MTAFLARYDKLKTSEPLAPRLELLPAPAHLFIPVQFGNLLQATTYGVEIAAHYASRWWRLDGGYSTFHLTPHLSPDSRDAAPRRSTATRPPRSGRRGRILLRARCELDAMLFHAGALPALLVAAYTRADARLEVPCDTKSVPLGRGTEPVRSRARGVRRAQARS